jgi:hypothetical protein
MECIRLMRFMAVSWPAAKQTQILLENLLAEYGFSAENKGEGSIRPSDLDNKTSDASRNGTNSDPRYFHDNSIDVSHRQNTATARTPVQPARTSITLPAPDRRPSQAHSIRPDSTNWTTHAVPISAV